MLLDRRRVSNVPWRLATDHLPGVRTAQVAAIASVDPTRQLLESGHVVLDDDDLLALIDATRWAGLTSLGQLRRLLDCAERHRHPLTPRFRRLLESGLLHHESPPERDLAHVLDGMGIEWQARLAPDLRVDGLLRAARLVIEYDGREDHATVAGRSHDAGRDQRLRDLGLHVMHITAEDLAEPQILHRRVTDVAGALGAVITVRADPLIAIPPAIATSVAANA